MVVIAAALFLHVGPAEAAVTLSAAASPSTTVNSPVFDSATIAGGVNPTGTLTFKLFGPNDATCAGPPVFTSVKPVSGNAGYMSDSFISTVAGTYRFVASYSGDANNAPQTTACGDQAQQVVVAPAIQIVKTVSPLSLPAPGGTFTFSIVVTNVSNQALTIITLVDDIYGNLTTSPGTTCNTAIGTVLQASPGPGNVYSCQFPGNFRGRAGDSQTDTVTVRARDKRGTEVTGRATARVTLAAVTTATTAATTAMSTATTVAAGDATTTASKIATTTETTVAAGDATSSGGSGDASDVSQPSTDRPSTRAGSERKGADAGSLGSVAGVLLVLGIVIVAANRGRLRRTWSGLRRH